MALEPESSLRNVQINKTISHMATVLFKAQTAMSTTCTIEGSSDGEFGLNLYGHSCGKLHWVFCKGGLF